jgi:hypothetical protein
VVKEGTSDNIRISDQVLSDVPSLISNHVRMTLASTAYLRATSAAIISAARLGFGRIVVSEKEVPITLVDLV